MNKVDFNDKNWWLKEVESRCINAQKATEKFRNSDVRYKTLITIASIVIILNIIIGIIIQNFSSTVFIGNISNNNTIILVESFIGIPSGVVASLNTLIMFVAGIVVGFTIDEYRNRRFIIFEQSCLLRPQILEEIVNELRENDHIRSEQVQFMLTHIKNGSAQICTNGENGIVSLNKIIENICEEISKVEDKTF